MSETVEDILSDIRRRAEVAGLLDEDATVHHSAVAAMLRDIADRLDAAHVHEINHIKAIAAEVKRRANNGNG